MGALWGLGILAGIVPAIGPAIAGGTLAAILSSAAAGAATAGVAGALIGLGIPEDEAKRGEEKDLYRGHLAFANANIKSVVDDLLSGPDDEDPIVIVQADEGPLFCRSVDCPEDSVEYAAVRYGVLNALYLQGGLIVSRMHPAAASPDGWLRGRSTRA